MLAPAKHRFSVTEYHRMAEVGLLRPDARVELLDGQIIDMSPIGPFHGGVVNRLTRLFNRHAKDRWLVSTQNPVRLNDQSEPQPDVMLLQPSAGDYTTQHPAPEQVFLLIEVSDSTLSLDREEKLPAYGRAGIAEVWIINLTDQAIEVYREPHFTGYGTKTIFRQGQQVRPHTFSDLVVDVAELMKR